MRAMINPLPQRAKHSDLAAIPMSASPWSQHVRPIPQSTFPHLMHISDGAFIVEDKDAPPYEYDDERLVVLGDFYYKSDYNLSSGLLAAPFQWTNDPQALTVNGNAYGECDPAVKACKSGCHTEVVTVEPDKTYRIRVIGAMALSFLCAIPSLIFFAPSSFVVSAKRIYLFQPNCWPDIRSTLENATVPGCNGLAFASNFVAMLYCRRARSPSRCF